MKHVPLPDFKGKYDLCSPDLLPLTDLDLNLDLVKVAEAAGLKHVPLPDFETDSDAAWAGSLKKTEKSKLRQGGKGKTI